MIEVPSVQSWQKIVPWTDFAQVEQDLVISRALVEIYSHPVLKEKLAFRGGTALTKLFFPEALYQRSKGRDLFDLARAEPLLPSGKSVDFDKDFDFIMENLISHLPGEAWKGIEEEEIADATTGAH